MGNRILKESIRMSEQIDQLSYFEEAMFYRLIVTVDDYGLYSANPIVLAHILFPMKEDVTKTQVSEALSHMEALGLIQTYRVRDKGCFLKLVSWEKHQRLRNSKQKHPLPEDAVPAGNTNQMATLAAGDANLKATVSAGNENRQAVPPPAPETPMEPDPMPELPWEEQPAEAETMYHFPTQDQQNRSADRPPENRSQAPAVAAAQIISNTDVRELPVIELPLNDNSLFPVSRSEMEEYTRLYPAVDVEQALRNMKGWCLANPQRRKTKMGIRKFINNWLSREQDKGGGKPVEKKMDNPFLRMAMGEDIGDEYNTPNSFLDVLNTEK